MYQTSCRGAMLRCPTRALLLLTAVPLAGAVPRGGNTTARAEIKLAWVGNSYIYYHDLPSLVERLAASAIPPQVVSHESVTVGGSSLSRLANDGAAQQMLTRDWDYVVLQDQSQIPGGARPLDRDATLESLRRYYKPALESVRAKALLYSTWGRRDGDRAHPDLYPDFATMNTLTTAGYEMYREVVDNPPWLPASVAPAGAAFALIHSDHDVAIFENLFDADGSHPSITGSYLVACVFYAQLTQLPSSGLPYSPAGVTAPMAAFYQSIADSVVLGSAPPAAAPLAATTQATGEFVYCTSSPCEIHTVHIYMVYLTGRARHIQASLELTTGRPSLLSNERVIQRQTYAFPSEYEAIECELTLVFSSGVVLGPVSLRLRRDESTTTTRCVCILSTYRYLTYLRGSTLVPVQLRLFPSVMSGPPWHTVRYAKGLVWIKCRGVQTSSKKREVSMGASGVVHSEAVQLFCGEACTWQVASYQCQQPISTGSSNTSLVWNAGDDRLHSDCVCVSV
jgi:hypothetical protein